MLLDVTPAFSGFTASAVAFSAGNHHQMIPPVMIATAPETAAMLSLFLKSPFEKSFRTLPKYGNQMTAETRLGLPMQAKRRPSLICYMVEAYIEFRWRTPCLP